MMAHPLEAEEWPDIAWRIKARAGWRCERCGHAHDPAEGYRLTVHDLGMAKANCADWNLAALCQRCHLSVQVRGDLEQAYMLEHSHWMRPHIEGYLRSKGLL